jgi:endonuclease YncB( thermonuclease family)
MELAQSMVRAALVFSLFCTTLQLDPSWVLRVIDGDTFLIRNAGITNTEGVRVCQTVDGRKAVCVNTPESDADSPDERLQAAAATVFAEEWLMAGPFTLAACQRDSFGRLLGVVTRGESNLGQSLLDSGHAVLYKRKQKITPSP